MHTGALQYNASKYFGIRGFNIETEKTIKVASKHQ